MSRLDQFAELLSQDIDWDAICERMGLRPEAARSMLSRIRKRLGSQAQ